MSESRGAEGDQAGLQRGRRVVVTMVVGGAEGVRVEVKERQGVQ